MSNEVTIFGFYNAQGIFDYFIQSSSHFKSTFFQNLHYWLLQHHIWLIYMRNGRQRKIKVFLGKSFSPPLPFQSLVLSPSSPSCTNFLCNFFLVFYFWATLRSFISKSNWWQEGQGPIPFFNSQLINHKVFLDSKCKLPLLRP